jgi:hypothetical protein
MNRKIWQQKHSTFLYAVNRTTCRRDRTVGIRPGHRPEAKKLSFNFLSQTFRPAHGPTQLPALWVPGIFPMGKGGQDMRLTTNHVTADITKTGTYICMFTLLLLFFLTFYTLAWWWCSCTETSSLLAVHKYIVMSYGDLLIVCSNMQLGLVPPKHKSCSPEAVIVFTVLMFITQQAESS